MKAAPITKKPSFPLMKQGDIQNIYHLQMPRWLFTDPRYIGLSLEAKVTYTFLLNRFQLSRLNGWLNDDGEVFIIYTRRSLSSEMQVSYHKIIEAMKELSSAGLIWERRCGRGDANQIYLALVSTGRRQAAAPPLYLRNMRPPEGSSRYPLGGVGFGDRAIRQGAYSTGAARGTGPSRLPKKCGIGTSLSPLSRSSEALRPV